MRKFAQLSEDAQRLAVLTVKHALWEHVHARVEKDTASWTRGNWEELGFDYLPRWGWRKLRWRLHRDLTNAFEEKLELENTAAWIASEASYVDEDEVAIELEYPKGWTDRALAQLPHLQSLDYEELDSGANRSVPSRRPGPGSAT